MRGKPHFIKWTFFYSKFFEQLFFDSNSTIFRGRAWACNTHPAHRRIQLRSETLTTNTRTRTGHALLGIGSGSSCEEEEEDEGPRIGEAALRVLQGGEAPGDRLHPLHLQPEAQAAPGLLHHRRLPPSPAAAHLRLRRRVRRVRRVPPLSLPAVCFLFLTVPAKQRGLGSKSIHEIGWSGRVHVIHRTN